MKKNKTKLFLTKTKLYKMSKSEEITNELKALGD